MTHLRQGSTLARLMGMAVLVVVSALAAATPGRAASLVVGSSADTLGSCATTTTCTLRSAVQQAAPGDTITFVSGLSAVILTSTLVISGTGITVDGMDAVTVDGTGLPARSSVISITGSDNTLRRLSVVGRLPSDPTIFDGTGNAIEIAAASGTGASNTVVEWVTVLGAGYSGIAISGNPDGGGSGTRLRNNLLGTTNGNALACNPVEANTYGIYIDSAAKNTVVDANVVVCSRQEGIAVVSSGTTGTRITNNRIGISADGTHALPNAGAGIGINFEASDVVVQNNVISGNGREGVYVGGDASRVSLRGNKVGTDATGMAPVPNALDGIVLTDGSFNNSIGGTTVPDRNIISGNRGSGLWLTGGARNNTVDGNFIGLNATGTAAIANLRTGITISNTIASQIGSATTTGANQYIAGNQEQGIYIDRARSSVVDESNFIGVAADGESPLGNRGAGVAVLGQAEGAYDAVWQIWSDYSYTGVSYCRFERARTLTVVDPESGDQDANTPYPVPKGPDCMGGGQPTLVSVMINKSAVVDGTTITFSYTVNSPAAQTIALGAGLRPSATETAAAGEWFYDPDRDVMVSVPAGTSTVTRRFLLATQRTRLTPSVIAYNSGLPIDLGNDGASTNDPGDDDRGPNTLLNFPYITGINGSTIYGKVCLRCSVRVYKTIGTAGTPRSGGSLLAKVPSSNFDWSYTLPPGLTYEDISLVSVDEDGNSSEISAQPTLTTGAISGGTSQQTFTSSDNQLRLQWSSEQPQSFTMTYSGYAAPPHSVPTPDVLAFNLEARTASGNRLPTSSGPFTLVIRYADADLVAHNISEQRLILAYWDGRAWVKLSSCEQCSVDTSANVITVVTDQYGEFALTEDDPRKVYLPAVAR